MTADSARISPTAHFTGAVWRARGLGDPRFDSVLDIRPHNWLSPAGGLFRPLLGGNTLDDSLVQRHLILDAEVAHALHTGVRNVIEVPAGFSARRSRLDRPGVHWVDGDLAAMAALRRSALGPDADIRTLDLLHDDGPTSLAAVVQSLPPEPLVVIIEGLLNYLSTETVLGIFRRILAATAHLPYVEVVGDVALGSHTANNPWVRLFLRTLGWATRGRTWAHFSGEAEAQHSVNALGFETVTLHSPRARAWELGLPAPNTPDYLCVLQARRGKIR